MRKSKPNTVPSREAEEGLWKEGKCLVCGLDEAGRGALAGPLVVGAVILPRRRIYRLRDSKTIPPKTREKLADHIKRVAVSWATAAAEVEEIDRYGIQSATYIAFYRAIERLKVKPDCLLVDFYRLPACDLRQISLTFGDKTSQTIAAASILAKVARDELMRGIAGEPEATIYQFDKNFGYGTGGHLEGIARAGASRFHRKEFTKKFLNNQTRLFEK